MGINVIGNTSTQEIRATALTAITAGDLVVNSEFGGTSTAPTSLNLTQINNISQGPSALIAAAQYQNANYATSSIGVLAATSAILGNGNIVSVFSGDGTTSTTRVNIQVRNVQNTLVASTTISGNSIGSLRVRRVNSTSFVVVYTQSSNLRFAIFNNDCTVVSADALIVGIVGGDSSYNNVNVLSNGNIVVAYTTSSSALAYRVYSSTGAVVLGETTTEASSSPQYMSITPQSSGGFVIYYKRTATTAAYKFARYDASGVLQGTLTTIFNTTNTLNRGPLDFYGCVELSNGNLVFQVPNVSSSPVLYIYTATGTLVASAVDISGTSNIYVANTFATVLAQSGNFVVTGARTSGTLTYSVYDNSGTPQIYQRSTGVGGTSNSSGSGGCFLYSLGAAGFVAVDCAGTSSCGFTGGIQIFTFNTSGSQTGSTINLPGTATTQYIGVCAVMTADNIMYINYSRNAMFNGTYQLVRRSISGVALETAAIGQTVRISPVGSYTINQDFGNGGVFDQRSATVPGTRGAVIGTSANLLGL